MCIVHVFVVCVFVVCVSLLCVCVCACVRACVCVCEHISDNYADHPVVVADTHHDVTLVTTAMTTVTFTVVTHW